MVNVVTVSPRTIQVSSNSTSGTSGVIESTVASPRTIQVSSNSTSGVIDSVTPVTIKNQNIYLANRLDLLLDVDPVGETNNATLVYNEETDSYIVKQIDLDGGFF